MVSKSINLQTDNTTRHSENLQTDQNIIFLIPIGTDL